MALKEMAVPDPPKLYTTRYERLGGVDYSSDITEISRQRTPTGTNLISDDGSHPVKRIGWRVISELNAGEIIKIMVIDRRLSTSDTTPDILAVTSSKVIGLRFDMPTTEDNPPEGYQQTVLHTASNAITNCALFTFNKEAYLIFAEGMYKVYSEGEFCFTSVVNSYIPEVSMGLTPEGTTDATIVDTASVEAVNLLSTKRRISFLGDSSSLIYNFYPTDIRNRDEYKWMVANTVVVEQNTANGWVTLTQGTDYSLETPTQVSGKNLMGNTTSYSVVPTHITFTSAKPPIVVGQDNIRVTFEQFNGELASVGVYYGLYKKNGSLEDLLSGFDTAVYGYSNPDRVFVAGASKRNFVYYSGVNNPTYFPDNNYLEIGRDDNEIVSLQRVSEYLAVIKADSVLDNTMYLISGGYLDDNMYFKVVPTSSTIGAIAPKASATLIDDPLFLSRNGVFGIASTYINTEKVTRNRSRYLDKKLTKEKNLKKACATVWDKYYVLCVNNHCYILDGRNVSRNDRNDLNYQYESYYWENIPAVCFGTFLDELYFGTFDGKICKFNTDVNDSTKYCDNGVEYWEWLSDRWNLTLTDRITVDDEEVIVASPIYCEWATPYDDDRTPQYFKTLNKKGNLVTLLPLVRSSAQVSLIKDGAKIFTLDKFYVNVFSWAKVFFEGFTFRSDLSARDNFIKKKVKKYKRLQIVISNDGMFEPFGILGITKTYSVGNFSK